MYDNEFKTKGSKLKPRIKLNHNSYITRSWSRRLVRGLFLGLGLIEK